MCAFVKNGVAFFLRLLCLFLLNGTITFNCLTEIRRSDSLNSYGMFQPKGPKFLLSWTIAWKKHKAHSNFRNTYQSVNSTCNVYYWLLKNSSEEYQTNVTSLQLHFISQTPTFGLLEPSKNLLSEIGSFK